MSASLHNIYYIKIAPRNDSQTFQGMIQFVESFVDHVGTMNKLNEDFLGREQQFHN